MYKYKKKKKINIKTIILHITYSSINVSERRYKVYHVTYVYIKLHIVVQKMI